MVSNFKLIPHFNILQSFVQNVRKPKWPFILSWCRVSAILWKKERKKRTDEKTEILKVKITEAYLCLCPTVCFACSAW